VNKNVTERRLLPKYYIFEHGGIKIGEKLIDLSSNLNPLGQPSFIKDVLENICHVDLQRFPNRDKILNYLSTIEEIEGELLYPVPGASTGILLIFLFYRPRTCVIPDITYVDYLRICRKLGIEMITIPTYVRDSTPVIDLEEFNRKLVQNNDKDTLVVIVNPNNPTGTVIRMEDIIKIIEIADRSRIVVDTTFIDFINQQKECRKLLNYDNVIIIKSLSKIISVPGMRIGYIAGKIVEELPELSWPLSTISEIVLDKIVNNLKEYKRFIEDTYRFISREINRVEKLLRNLQLLEVYRSHTHMFLIKAPEDLYEYLLTRYKIKIRKYCVLSSGDLLYRASIRDRESNDILIKALMEFDKYA